MSRPDLTPDHQSMSSAARFACRPYFAQPHTPSSGFRSVAYWPAGGASGGSTRAAA